ncbi:MAG TPA: hypothetical protein VIZ30_01690 [Pseudomonadales bacterium]
MITRRVLLKWSGAAFFAGVGSRLAASSATDGAKAALEESDLVYLTPLKRDASESTCHAEIWFVFDGADVYVVTSSTAWRAQAVSRGLTQARLWVGEFGNWKDAKDAYRRAPEFMASAAIVNDAQVHATVLERFGKKYSVEWLYYGPKFRDGLQDGSRVMLRYTPTA